jgi:hypothetical protein
MFIKDLLAKEKTRQNLRSAQTMSTPLHFECPQNEFFCKMNSFVLVFKNQMILIDSHNSEKPDLHQSENLDPIGIRIKYSEAVEA